MKKLLAVLLTLTLISANLVVAFAADTSTVPVNLTVEPQIFSITVPTVLLITQTSTGEVQVADNVVITNNSAGPVKITDISTTGVNGWSTVDYDGLDVKSAKVGIKNVGFLFKIGGTETKTTGADLNNFASSVSITKGQSIPIIYDAKLPAQSTALVNTQVAEVVFTFGWDE